VQKAISTHRYNTTALWVTLQKTLQHITLINCVTSNDYLVTDATITEVTSNVRTNAGTFTLA
jgi:hypothetical protein